MTNKKTRATASGGTGASVGAPKPSRRFGLVKLLAYARYTIAGGIGGSAIYNTIILVSTAAPTQSFESVAMAAGAIIGAAAVKVLHVV
ncbi:MAG: hypothetical protein V4757_07350 [Pseudomonadota bacterium]